VSEDIWWFRLVTLVLGALPQVIKLYGMEGIPWTQAWASIYLLAFLIIEILTQVGGTEWTQSQLDFTDPVLCSERFAESLHGILAFVGCAVQVVIWGLVCAMAIPTDMLYTISPDNYKIYERGWLFWPTTFPLLFVRFIVVGVVVLGGWGFLWGYLFFCPIVFAWFAVRILCDKYILGSSDSLRHYWQSWTIRHPWCPVQLSASRYFMALTLCAIIMFPFHRR
jgi:hypothetical protein